MHSKSKSSFSVKKLVAGNRAHKPKSKFFWAIVCYTYITWTLYIIFYFFKHNFLETTSVSKMDNS